MCVSYSSNTRTWQMKWVWRNDIHTWLQMFSFYCYSRAACSVGRVCLQLVDSQTPIPPTLKLSKQPNYLVFCWDNSRTDIRMFPDEWKVNRLFWLPSKSVNTIGYMISESWLNTNQKGPFWMKRTQKQPSVTVDQMFIDSHDFTPIIGLMDSDGYCST